jgi:hypothetical protein
MVPTEGALVLLDERAGRYFQLNVTGAAMLTQLLAGSEQDAIVADLANRYPVTEDDVRADLGSLLDQLCTAGLVLR